MRRPIVLASRAPSALLVTSTRRMAVRDGHSFGEEGEGRRESTRTEGGGGDVLDLPRDGRGERGVDGRAAEYAHVEHERLTGGQQKAEQKRRVQHVLVVKNRGQLVGAQ